MALGCVPVTGELVTLRLYLGKVYKVMKYGHYHNQVKEVIDFSKPLKQLHHMISLILLKLLMMKKKLSTMLTKM